MVLTDHICKRCGGSLQKRSESTWKCQYCGTVFDDETAARNTESIKAIFDEEKRELIANLRRNLYDAVRAEYISSEKVIDWCREIKKLLPDDFAANFYEVAASDNVKQITAYIREIDTDEHYEDMDIVIEFLIRSLQSEYLLELNNLIERTYKKKSLATFEKYATELSHEAEKVQSGVYETLLPRDAFIAYSAKDMDFVSALVEVLEEQGIKCFVSARNLRHGKGSVENYDKALKEAMDNCKSFVFVSSTNSRSLSCDALKIELPYIKGRDISNAPSEYRNNYIAIPHIYKKPRVEFRINESPRYNAGDEIVKEFFDGYEWALSPEAVAKRVMDQLISLNLGERAAEEPSEIPAVPRMTKYDDRHTHKYIEKAVAPTCISKGYTLHVCECGDQYKDGYTALAEHSFGDWSPIKRATCEDSGQEQRVCRECGHEEKREIPATGHDFGPWQEYSKNGKSMGEIRICRNCGCEDIRSHADKIGKKSGAQKLWLSLFWIGFCVCVFGALFMYGGGSNLELIKAYNPLGLALAEGSSRMSFAMITMTVWVGIVYILFLFASLGEEKPTRLGLRAIYITSVMLALWYAEYGICHLLVKIDGGFHFWTIVIGILLNVTVGCILIYFSTEKLFAKYLKDPEFTDDNEKAVYLRWRSARAWMVFSAIIFWIGMSLVAGLGDATGVWNQGIAMVMMFEGLIMTVVNGIRTVSRSRVRGTSRDIRKQIADGNSFSAILAFVMCVCAVIFLGSIEKELIEDICTPAFLSMAFVAIACAIASAIAKKSAKKSK